MKVKAPVSGWHEVTYEQALRFAASRYRGMTCRDPVRKVNELLQGVSFIEKELRDAINRT